MALTTYATTDVVTASRDEELTSVLEMMDDHHVGSVIVVEDDDPVGIVSDRKIAMHLRDVDSIDGATVEECMTENPVTVDESTSHFEVLERMAEEGIRRIPITEAGSLTGIITLDDMLTVTAAELSNIADVVEKQTGG